MRTTTASRSSTRVARSSPRGGATARGTDGSGKVYVADAGKERSEECDSSGTFLTTWGRGGTGTGQFRLPVGVATDGSGNVYVADADNNRIQKFDSTGTFLTTWGSFGT